MWPKAQSGCLGGLSFPLFALFSRWRLRKLRAFLSVEAEKILCFFFRRGLRKFCFFVFLVLLLLLLFFFFFPPEIQGLVVLRNIFLKSYTFACGWEELSLIVRVTFSYAFFFSLRLCYIIEWTCSSFSLRKADVPGWKNRWEKVVIPTRHLC